MTTQINLTSSVKLEGLFTLEVIDTLTGKVTKKVGPFKNLITNAGLDDIWLGVNTSFAQQWLITAFVGTGNTAPAVTDTQMTALLAPTSYSVPPVGSPMSSWTYVAAAGSVPPYWTSTGTWSFAAGQATGTLAEVGIGVPITTTTYRLDSHALIVDGSGNPTTITVLSNEQLNVTYTLNLYWDVTTYTGTVSISGVTYNISWLPCNLPAPTGTSYQSLSSQGNGFWSYLTGYNGSLGTPLTLPSGSSGDNASGPSSYGAYSTGQYYIDVTWSCDINHMNLVGGITVLTLGSNFHKFQIGFSPAIPKTSSYSFTFVCRFAWARYP